MSTVSEFSLCFSLYFLFQLRILHLCFKFVLIAHLTVRKKRKCTICVGVRIRNTYGVDSEKNINKRNALDN